MGIDYDGGMIVGELGMELEKPEDFDGELYEWVEEVGLDRMSQWYDSDIDYNYVGFRVDNVVVDDIDEWLRDVRKKAKEFYRLTGVPARLIGTQNIT